MITPTQTSMLVVTNKIKMTTTDHKYWISTIRIDYLQIVHAQRAGVEWHEDLENVCTNAGLKGKKLTKVRPNDHVL